MDSLTVHNLCLSVHKGGPLHQVQEKVTKRQSNRHTAWSNPTKLNVSKGTSAKTFIQFNDRQPSARPLGKMQRKHANFNSLSGGVLEELKYDEITLYDEVSKLREINGDRRAPSESKIRVVPTNWNIDTSVQDTLFEEHTKLAILASLQGVEEQMREIVAEPEVPEVEDDWEMVDESKSDSAPDDVALFATESDSFVQLRKSFRAVLLENNEQPFVLAGHGNNTKVVGDSYPLRTSHSEVTREEFDTDYVDGDANLSGMSFHKYSGYKKYAVDRRLKRRWK